VVKKEISRRANFLLLLPIQASQSKIKI